jgi:hypothetical protein
VSAPLVYFGNPGSGSGSGCACGETPLLRVAGAILIGGGDITNMIAWIEAFDITTVPWGNYNTGNFTSPSQTTPPTQSSGLIAGAFTGSVNQLKGLDVRQSPPGCTIAASGTPNAYRAQAYLPTPTAYYIVAWGDPMDASLSETCGNPAFWVAQGCNFEQEEEAVYPMIVDLPIPDDTLDASILVQNYYLGIITPGAGYNNMNGPLFAEQQDLIGMGAPGYTLNSVGMNGFGPNWNPAAVCANTISPSDVDPFTGVYDPP